MDYIQWHNALMERVDRNLVITNAALKRIKEIQSAPRISNK